jgi:hypothetical protein
MACIITRHVTHWAGLGCSGSTCRTACPSSHQYPATKNKDMSQIEFLPMSSNFSPSSMAVWQHSTGNNHCMKLMVVTPDTDCFSDPRP